MCDGNVARRQMLATSAAAAGIALIEAASIGGGALLAEGVTRVALVYLGDGAPHASALTMIRDLSARRVRVIGYGGGLATWPLGARCQPLIAGAAAMLDSSDRGFAAELWRQVEALLAHEARSAQVRIDARAHFGRLGIVGVSESMHRLYDWTSRVAPLSDLHVLVTGETGTGKQLFAQALHQLDRKRRAGPFVVVNCGAISPGLAESELFGHRRGAYTGAERERGGLFRAAHGGILLLDEIGEMEIGLQAKVLRVLQEGRVLAVGDDREVAVDVRVIAATHRDLGAMVVNGAFRADLFHRLNGLTLDVPPVRERRGDIPLLVDHVLAKHVERTGTTPIVPSEGFLSALARLPLPGNVRELEHAVRHAVAVAEDAPALDLAHLPAAIWAQLAALDDADTTLADSAWTADPAGASGDERTSWPVQVPDAWTLARSLAWCERAIVSRALDSVDGNQARAARLLGVTPRSVYNKLRKHHLMKRRA